jgi:hypothetical protein
MFEQNLEKGLDSYSKFEKNTSWCTKGAFINSVTQIWKI